MKFFEDQNILTDYQHGFRKKRSCESQLITTIQDLASGIDSSRFGMFEVLSVENTDENCEFSSFALVFGSPCKFPFSFREDLVVVNKYNSI
jgi:hypothetical protein